MVETVQVLLVAFMSVYLYRSTLTRGMACVEVLADVAAVATCTVKVFVVADCTVKVPVSSAAGMPFTSVIGVGLGGGALTCTTSFCAKPCAAVVAHVTSSEASTVVSEAAWCTALHLM